MHPYLVQPKLVRHCAALGIAVTAFSPLGAGSYVQLGMASPAQSALVDPVVLAIAARVSATPAQVVLAWGLARGCAVIPKCSTVARIKENFGAAGVTLTDADVAAISKLDKHMRFNDPGVFCELAFKTFCPIYD